MKSAVLIALASYLCSTASKSQSSPRTSGSRASPTIMDCNGNGLPDDREISKGLVPDANANFIPDDCERADDLPYGYRKLVVFGDSLSDTGNLFAQFGLPPSPPYFEGRFSNGRVWVEYLADFLGIPQSRVDNYALGGATTGHDNASIPGAGGLLDQIELYTQLVARKGPPDPDTLFVLWAGPNDFSPDDGIDALGPIEDLVRGSIDNIELAIRSLASLGAQKILVPNLPDLGAAPLVDQLGDPAAPSLARTATVSFNGNLAWRLAGLEQELGIEVTYFDVFTLFEDVVSNPKHYGFVDVEHPRLQGEPGAGLLAEIYQNSNLRNLVVTRVDSQVNFDWQGGSPAPAVGADTFSVRWTGFLEPEVAGTHTFHAISDDGVRLWIDGQLIINHWFDQAARERSGSIQLAAWQRVPIRLEYYDNGGVASCRLEWSAPGLPRELIPTERLSQPHSGLEARIFDDIDAAEPTLSRIDALVDFNWGQASPHPTIASNTFRIAWSGRLEADSTQPHTLFVVADDGVRLWIRDELVIDGWVVQAATQYSAVVPLVAGEKVPIRLEYFEDEGEASCRLEWSAPGLSRSVIPSRNLSPAPKTADGYLFWDDLHPTTKAHRILAVGAQSSILTGGKALPNPPCVGCPIARIKLFGDDYTFTDGSTHTVTGRVTSVGLPPGEVQVRVQGEETPVNGSGEFIAEVPLSDFDVATAISAEVISNGAVLDRDRVLVFRGQPTQAGEVLPRGAAVHLTAAGVQRVRDELVFHLADQAFREQLDDAAQGFIPFNVDLPLCGEVSGALYILGASFGCLSVDLQPENGQLKLTLYLDQVKVYYHLDAGLSDCPDDLDCSGNLFFPQTRITYSLDLVPSSGGFLSVVETRPATVDLPTFAIFGCDFLLDIASVVDNFFPEIWDFVHSSIVSQLGSLSSQIPSLLNTALANVDLSAALSSSLGLDVQTDVTEVHTQGGSIDLVLDVGFGSPSQGFQNTLRLPGQLPSLGGIDSWGQPYDFAVSLSLAVLNQLLLEAADQFLAEHTLYEIDLGSGNRTLTSDLLGALIPPFSLLPKGTELAIRIRPLVPPMVLMPTATDCALVDVVLDRVSVDIVQANAPATVLFGVEARLQACIDVHGDAASSELVVRMPANAFAATVVATHNPARIDTSDAELLLESLLLSGIAVLGDQEVRLSLPDFGGASFPVSDVSRQNGFLSTYFRVDSPHGRPDLVMTMQSPGDVSPNFPFTVNGTIKNIGSQPAVASSPGITARFRLSVDSVLWNWDEAELGQFVVRGPGQPIHPGEVVPFSFVLGPVNGAVITGQTLFGWADSAGLLCEGSEENNLAQTPVGVSCPDVYVASFSPPSNWVGGQTRNYRVRVGRNNHAPDSLTVDVRVDLLFADGQVWSWNRLANVPRGTEIDVDVPATAPMVNANAGDSLPFLTKVTLSLPNGFGGVNCDENIANNVQSIWVPIAAPYFDLRLEVLGPSSAQRNSWVNYTVRVENHGNASQAWEVCGAATIGLNPGAVGIPFDLCLPASLNVNFLDPGESITIPFFCFIPGNAASRQYMKAVLWTFGCQNGCADCFANGNYAHKELTIY